MKQRKRTEKIIYSFNPLTNLDLFLLSIDERASLMVIKKHRYSRLSIRMCDGKYKKTISSMYSKPIKGEKKGYF